MLKAIARRAIGKDHWDFLSWYRTSFGALPAIRAYLDLLRNKGIGRAPDGQAGGSVFLRPGTSDQDVYREVFISREYDIDLGDPRFIVDAGAHIGLSTVFFASRYPKATIVAIEPEPSNFEILLMNTKRYPNVRPIRAGLWNRKAHLRIEDSRVATWSFRVVESPTGEGIPAVAVRDVMTDFEAASIDVLKIDIEGSELEVLSHSREWLGDVRTLIIELHDRFRPGCSEALDKALGEFHYRRGVSGESVVITDIGRIAP